MAFQVLNYNDKFKKMYVNVEDFIKYIETTRKNKKIL